MPEHRNRLADESSPYLLQHAHNPVDWYPWGPEALERARREDRPILLSVGYAACHWCHVMERESFEDVDTAALMNEHFVCIKVDREERPDVDDVYMRAVQMMTGHGGWPLTVFLTPELEPYYGGTYFPPEDRPGMPSFRRLLLGVAEAYRERREEVAEMAGQVRAGLQVVAPESPASGLPAQELVERGALELHDRFDPNHGGFGGAPKFPNATSISLLLRYSATRGDQDALQAATFSLQQMAAGGIHDHVGGGFHRYATDSRWLVPHFEKMLYDNALLATAYLEAFQITGAAEYANVARGILDWVEREMQHPEGGYYSTLDADSEGIEGKYYVWTVAQLESVLGDDAERFAAAYDATAAGNWEGNTILNLPRPLDHVAGEAGMDTETLLRQLRGNLESLREAREARVRPGLDDKVLADWNGLMIAAMALGARVLGEDRYRESAERAAEFVCTGMHADGRLLHTWRDGEAKLPAFLDDHANMLMAFLQLVQTTSRGRWMRAALGVAEQMHELFHDPEGGALHFTGALHEALIARPKIAHDGATPAGNAVAARGLLLLGHLTGRAEYTERGVEIVQTFGGLLHRAPSACSTLLLALDDHLADSQEVVVVGGASDRETSDAVQHLWRTYAAARPVLWLRPADEQAEQLTEHIPALVGKSEAAASAGPSIFVCRNHTCAAPLHDLESVLRALA